MNLCKKAFPNFELDVVIPEGFEDISYKNDVCPSWWHEEKGLVLFIDFAKPEDREIPTDERFALITRDDVTCESVALITTDSYDEILKLLEVTPPGTAPGQRVMNREDIQDIWDALHDYRQCVLFEGVSVHDAKWDDICTAMAWLEESAGIISAVDAAQALEDAVTK